MYINPFVAGALSLLMAELVALVVYALFKVGGNKHGDKEV